MSVENGENRHYEPPAVRRLGGVEAGRGGSQCSPMGSSDIGDCATGNGADESCFSDGNSAGYQCGNGNDGGA